jgi:hypothetical protein
VNNRCCCQLDILAGVKVAGKARGQLLLNGSPRRSAAFASLASYVQQKDVLVPSATVRRSSSSSSGGGGSSAGLGFFLILIKDAASNFHLCVAGR